MGSGHRSHMGRCGVASPADCCHRRARHDLRNTSRRIARHPRPDHRRPSRLPADAHVGTAICATLRRAPVSAHVGAFVRPARSVGDRPHPQLSVQRPRGDGLSRRTCGHADGKIRRGINYRQELQIALLRWLSIANERSKTAPETETRHGPKHDAHARGDDAGRMILGAFTTAAVAVTRSGVARQLPPSFGGRHAGEEREIDAVRLCWCPPGPFVMGSPPSEPDRRPGEDQVDVTLTRGFWMAKDEATQCQWKRIVGELPGPLTAECLWADDLPVGNVNFVETEAFWRKLTERAHQSGALPKDWKFRLRTSRGRRTTGRSKGLHSIVPRESAITRPTRGGFTTCTATSSSGAAIGIMCGCLVARTLICISGRVPQREASMAASPGRAAAGAGPMMGGLAGRPFARGSKPSGGMTTPGFAWPPCRCERWSTPRCVVARIRGPAGSSKEESGRPGRRNHPEP
jgi:hypothetical protein